MKIISLGIGLFFAFVALGCSKQSGASPGGSLNKSGGPQPAAPAANPVPDYSAANGAPPATASAAYCGPETKNSGEQTIVRYAGCNKNLSLTSRKLSLADAAKEAQQVETELKALVTRYHAQVNLWVFKPVSEADCDESADHLCQYRVSIYFVSGPHMGAFAREVAKALLKHGGVAPELGEVTFESYIHSSLRDNLTDIVSTKLNKFSSVSGLAVVSEIDKLITFIHDFRETTGCASQVQNFLNNIPEGTFLEPDGVAALQSDVQNHRSALIYQLMVDAVATGAAGLKHVISTEHAWVYTDDATFSKYNLFNTGGILDFTQNRCEAVVTD